MKILLIGNYPPPYGGISVHVQLLHRLLLRHLIDCKVLDVDQKAFYSKDYINIKSHFDFLTKLIFNSPRRIVHFHTNGHNIKSWLLVAICGWVGYMIGRGAMLTIHSGMAPDYMKQNSFWHHQLIKFALLPQSLIICVNPEIQQALTYFNFKMKNALLIPAFLFDETENTSPDPDLKNLLSQFNPLISMVAFFRPEYGIELLIQSLAILKLQFPSIGCAVMGSGDGQEQLKQLAQESGVEKHLLWLGDRDHKECLKIIKYSQLFVRPTLVDGDSISVREAIQMSVPVVASDVGNRPELALLFRPGNATDLAIKCATVLTSSTAHQQSPVAPLSNFLTLIDAYNRVSCT